MSDRMHRKAFKCESTSNAVRFFKTYDEAYRFVMREGYRSRLWSLDQMTPAAIDADLNALIAYAKNTGLGDRVTIDLLLSA